VSAEKESIINTTLGDGLYCLCASSYTMYQATMIGISHTTETRSSRKFYKMLFYTAGPATPD